MGFFLRGIVLKCHWELSWFLQKLVGPHPVPLPIWGGKKKNNNSKYSLFLKKLYISQCPLQSFGPWCVSELGGDHEIWRRSSGPRNMAWQTTTLHFHVLLHPFNTLFCPGQDSPIMSHAEKPVIHKKVKQYISHRRQSYNTALHELPFILNNEIVFTVCRGKQLHLPNLLLNLFNIKGSEDLLIFQAFSMPWWRWVCILSHSLLLYYPFQ